MRNVRKVRSEMLVLLGALAVMFAMSIAIFHNDLAIVSHAAEQGTITAESVNIRKEASTSSAVVGSSVRGKTVTINSETTGTDGKVWYQVVVDADTVGYIRSDLVKKSGDTTTPSAPAQMNPTVEVTAVQPQGATVTGGQQVRVRADASTSSGIIATANNGTAITVEGQATGTDSKTWYQVSFTANGSEVRGFIRSDYVQLSGELVPAGTDEPDPGQPEEPDEGTETQPPQAPVQEKKPYETALEGETWYLMDYNAGLKWPITDTLKCAGEHPELKSTVKKQTVIIIILVIFLVLAVLAATLMYFKVKDVMDDAYFSAVEKETLRERGGRQAGGMPDRKVMPTVGDGPRKAPASAHARNGEGRANDGRTAGERPNGGRPVSEGRPAGNRPAGNRPAGERPNGGRPAGERSVGERPNDGRPAGNRPAGERPNGGRPVSEGRPAGNRPAGERPNGGRPAGEALQGRQPGAQTRQGTPVRPQGDGMGRPQNRPEGRPVSDGEPQSAGRPVSEGRPQSAGRPISEGRQPQPRQAAPKDDSWKSKNFMNEDEDFDFEFLKWDEEDK